jgi:hypothetical protein
MRYSLILLLALAGCSTSTPGSIDMRGSDGSAAVLDLTMPTTSPDLAGADLAMSSSGGDMGKMCHAGGGACTKGPTCPGAPGGCCGQGEWCQNGNTCLCGSMPPCTGGKVCSSGVAMVNGCGSTCCTPPGCP